MLNSCLKRRFLYIKINFNNLVDLDKSSEGSVRSLRRLQVDPPACLTKQPSSQKKVSFQLMNSKCWPVRVSRFQLFSSSATNLHQTTVWRGVSVQCGIKFIVFYLLLLTISLLRYFYYTLVRLSL